VVWACESVCHAANKADFIKESFRILKKGGRLILADFFATSKQANSDKDWLNKWMKTWAVPNYATTEDFKKACDETGFAQTDVWDYTDHIRKSAKRMYYAAILGALPSEMYNLFHPKVSRFAKDHYKCGYYQYKALQEQLWTYNIILAQK
jgi:ubiquinone/menaquinone biosynthesis C-methylase UbiE